MTTVWLIAFGVLAVLALCYLVMRLVMTSSSAIRLRPGWLCLVVGLRGHGKSLFVARLIAERLDAGATVYANFTVNGSGVERMRDWQDVILAPYRSMVVIDEASQWCGSRAGHSLRPAARWYIAQCRKLGHEVWLIAQHETQIAGEIRDQVNEIVECRKVGPAKHRARSWAPHEFRKKDARPLWGWWYSPKGRAIEVYDTLDLVPPERTRRSSVDEDIDMIEEAIAAIVAMREPSFSLDDVAWSAGEPGS